MPNEVSIIKTADEAEDADYYVCVRASQPARFTDDLYDFCCECGEKVRHRPHGPTIPKKICLECAMPGIRESSEKGDLQITTTEACAREAAPFLRKPQ